MRTSNLLARFLLDSNFGRAETSATKINLGGLRGLGIGLQSQGALVFRNHWKPILMVPGGSGQGLLRLNGKGKAMGHPLPTIVPQGRSQKRPSLENDHFKEFWPRQGLNCAGQRLAFLPEDGSV